MQIKILISLLLWNVGFANLLTITINGVIDVKQAIEQDFAIDDENNLHLVYTEIYQGMQKLVYLKSGEDFNWNLTRTYLDSPIIGQVINSRASILIWQAEIIIAFAVGSIENYSLIILKKGQEDKEWQLSYSLSNNSFLTRPILRAGSDECLWLAWLMKSNGIMNIFYQRFNWTSQSWSRSLKITDAITYDCSEFDYYVDKSNNGYYTWIEGGENKQVFYRKVFSNETKLPTVILTDGVTNCVDPTCLQEQDNSMSVFWSNYTDPDPGTSKGTIFVNSRKVLENNTITNIIEAAPYTSIFKGGESDGYSPSVALDTANTLWLAFTARDDQDIYRGVNLRARYGENWGKEEHITQIFNFAIEPIIKIDNDDNVHCIWIDFRSAYAQLFYRVRLSSGFWIEEKLLTHYITESHIGQKWFGITIGIITGAIIPIIIFNQIRKLRKRKLTKQQIKSLQD